MKKSLLAVLLAGSLLAACDNGGNNTAPPPTPPPAPPPAPGPTGAALSDVVHTAFTMTSETSLPLDINALNVNPDDETPTLYDDLLI